MLSVFIFSCIFVSPAAAADPFTMENDTPNAALTHRLTNAHLMEMNRYSYFQKRILILIILQNLLPIYLKA
jgi:hypothetical protein